MCENIIEENLVAVIGIGFRLPSGNINESIDAPSQLFNNLMNGLNGVVNIRERWNEGFKNEFDCSSAGFLPLEEWKLFDPVFFGLNPGEAETIDPQQRLLLKCTYEALEDGGIDPITLRGSNTSVYIGCSTQDYRDIGRSLSSAQSNIFGKTSHSASNRISYCFDFHGPSFTIDSACSSSTTSIILGYESIKSGKSNCSIVGGVNMIIDLPTYRSFSLMNILSKKAGRCMTFDADADGYVRSEGVGVVVLKNLNHAIKDGNDIYCVVSGASLNVDGNGLEDKLNFYSPSSISQAENIKMALKSTNGLVDRSDIDYIECHGTGTPKGDPVELEGISMVFKDSTAHSPSNPLLVGSIKSNIGHLEACSGVASLIKCCLMFKNKCFLPNINFKNPNPLIKFDEWNLKVVTQPMKFNEDKQISMIINNFGVTGSNSCLILQQFKNKNKSINKLEHKSYLIPFSSCSAVSLKKYQESIVLKDNDFNTFVLNQIYKKSLSLYQRSVIIARDSKEFNNIEKRTQFQTKNDFLSNISIKQNNPTVVYILCGQGSQYNKMGLELYKNEPVFRDALDLMNTKFSDYYGYSILEKLRLIEDSDSVSINQQIIVQPSNIMIQVGLFELYKHWGVEPSVIIGHSLGEISTAYCSGMIDMDTLCYLVYNRSILQQKTQGTGRMLSINISSEQFKNDYSSKYPTLEIACYNSPSSIVIAGNEDHLNEIYNSAKEKGIFAVMLGSLTAIHTSSQMAIKDEILELNFKSQQPKTPTFSTVTAELFNHDLLFNSQYVYHNILQPVKFDQTISNLYKFIEENQLNSNVCFIEISPHPTLIFYLKQMVPNNSKYFNNGKSIDFYTSLNRKKNDSSEIQKTISELFCSGYNGINFKSQFNNQKYTPDSGCYNLPLYKWDDKAYWIEDTLHQQLRIDGPSVDHLGISNKEASPFIKSFQAFIDIAKLPFQYLMGHQIKGKYYYPGCGYIINLIKIFSNQDITISHMEFKTPLILKKGSNECLQTNIYQTGKTEYKVLNHFKDGINQWVQSASGNFQLFSHGENIIKLNIQKILQNQCNKTVIKKEELYDFIKMKTGLQYSGAFRGVEKCFLGDNCSLSIVSLELPNGYIDQVSEKEPTFFNTSILDSCLHGLISLINEQSQMVFDNVSGFKYYSKNIPKDRTEFSEIYVYSELKKIMGNSYVGSITIMLSDGTVLIDIDEIVCTSLTDTKYPYVIDFPKDIVYTSYLQQKDSILPPPSTFKSIFYCEVTNEVIENYSNSIKFISTTLLKYIMERNKDIQIDIVRKLNIEQLKEKYLVDSKNERLFNYIFETIKNHYNEDVQDIPVIDSQELIEKSIKIIAKMLFPLESDNPFENLPQSLFEDNILKEYYDRPTSFVRNDSVGEIIKSSIKPILKEKILIKILELGGGTCSLSKIVLNKINTLLLDNQGYEINIEYTWTDISPSFIFEAKNQLSQFKGVSIVYNIIDLEVPLIKQGLKPSYFDFIIMANVVHVVKNISYAIEQIYQVLSPNGQLLLIEPPNRSIIADTIFSCFEQWYSFEDMDIRKDRCYIDNDTWVKLLNQHNFKSDILITNPTEYYCTAIQAQKISLNNILPKIDSSENVIIFSNSGNFFINTIKSLYKLNNIKIISNMDQFKNFINLSIINNNTTIYFIKTVDEININNFKEITLEYIEINQHLLKFKLNTKHILVTLDSDSLNYLSSSVVGAARYFDEYLELKLFTLNFDKQSIINQDIFSIIPTIINCDFSIHREFFIKNNNVFYERFKKETNLNQNFKSNSYIVQKKENIELFKLTLSPNLEYQLKQREVILEPNQVEIKIMAFGVNYKDYLIYSGNVPKIENRINGDINDPEFCYDFSGVITRIGSGSNLDLYPYTIGDQVYGLGKNSSASHMIVDMDAIYFKPKNLSHCESSALPTIYLTSYYSIYIVGNLKHNETVLIHSASGGVGLAALNILKMNHKGLVFVTVGSKEKEDYLIKTYGNFISGIFSSRDKNYCQQIKNTLKEMGSDRSGVDLILNTLSSNYMDSNFKSLTTGGRIVDLSITHLNTNEFTNNINFKYNFGYFNIELQYINNEIKRKLLKKITKAIESNKLNNILPITEFSNKETKDAIEYINQRKHIGKIIVNNKYDIMESLIEKQKEEKLLKLNYEINGLGETILITGQSGIILDILKWILKYSKTVKNVIILTKSKLKWGLEFVINSYKENINFYFKSLDISNLEALENSISEVLLSSNIKNIDSIFHFAFEHVLGGVQDISLNHLNISHNGKTLGAVNLHNLSIKLKWKLTNFIMASSVVSCIGSTDQCTYVCANRVLDSLSKYRKSIGLPSICTNWGMLQSSGFTARNQSVIELLDGQGLNPVTINTVIGSLDLMIQNQDQSTNLIVSDFNFNLLFNFQGSNFNKFDYQLNLVRSLKQTNNSQKETIDSIFLNKLAELLSIDQNKINIEVKLNSLGVDSLLMVQLKNFIDKEISTNIITIQQLQNNTIQSSIETIKSEMEKRGNEKPDYNSNGTTILTKAEKKLEYWENEIKLDDSIIKLSIENKSIPKQIINNKNNNIFLTGATGFLGVYLLYELLMLPNCTKVYCLIRNKSKDNNPINEIYNNMKKHLLYDNLNTQQLSKINVIVGDLSKNQFGLNNKEFKLLSNDINLIINSGADINLSIDYESIKPVNVNGVKEIIKLSLSSSKIIVPIVNFSTYSVFMKQELKGDFKDNFDEQQFGLVPLENLNILPGGYMQSKVIGEYILCCAAKLKSIPYIIIRSPSIFSNPTTGIGHGDDFGQLLIQVCSIIGHYPDLSIGHLASPITWCVENFLKVIFNENSWSTNNNSPISKLNVYNINSEVLNTETLVKNIGERIDYSHWKNLINQSEHKTCIKLRTFHSLNYSRFNIPNCYGISKRTKQLLISLGSYGNGGIINNEMINNHLNYYNKK
ncbi:hypothetical protein DICPUDRAFT_36677 [Dictyostelium purpureum]|uniref:Uncharacterized protein n=1 Tax=Dictyostelium purpureum TaxID=5786 RepID=F0ZRF3_DICPU|nr:uncharacterized protein DICPUDRAFT_36677 [Dictyostelium purpureum]EGC33471.1 hypothetical protein DICPUDRAFT_36677 [Dictyostelium purpureum]|eukprot:XP_003289994.1 hypothetical protein DICPUDRAFT_36677 [Dictyostelium purpureum]